MLEHYNESLGTLELVNNHEGGFDVFVDGRRIYSKQESGVFPEWETIQAGLQAHGYPPARSHIEAFNEVLDNRRRESTATEEQSTGQPAVCPVG